MTRMINPGKYNQKIRIVREEVNEDSDGFNTRTQITVLEPFAEVKTTSGFTLITSNTEFEKAYTNFTIRFPKVLLTKEMLVVYKGKTYTIEYLNDIDEEGIELEIQAKEVIK